MAQILVVDDEAAVRGALVAHLEAMGHRCEEAGNGLEALQVLHRREVDVILSDVAMPLMNGLQFLERALPYLERRVPVVLLSSVDDRGAISAAVGAGVFDYLTKPADPDEVRRVIEGCLAQRAEVLRLEGPRRGPGGPVPRHATEADRRDRKEAPRSQSPAGVPAFRPTKPLVTIPSPDAAAEDAAALAQRASWLGRVRRWFGRDVA